MNDPVRGKALLMNSPGVGLGACSRAALYGGGGSSAREVDEFGD